jgi:phosphotransferase system HPr (HPr) family protein
MVERRVVVRLREGVHARPAAQLAQLASEFAATVQLCRDSLVVDARSALGILSLAAEYGAELLIRAEGPDAHEVVECIAAFLQGEKQVRQER